MMQKFGEMPDGTEVHRVQLSGNVLTANILTYGAVVQDLRLDGHEPALVLGFEEFDSYLAYSPYFGATVGRYANRIRDGHLEIDGQTYQLDQNFIGQHCLHGGSLGTGKRVWAVDNLTPDTVALSIVLADGEMGFSGEMKVQAIYSLLPEGTLDIKYSATTDKPTLCNFAHHSYFNLDGGSSILDHILQAHASHYTPVDNELIPTGQVLDVEGTGFDFLEPKKVAAGGQDGLLDHNFCLSSDAEELRPVAELHSQLSGVSMRVNTTEPGLQVYDGAKIDVPVPGLAGTTMKAHAGIAIEPQVWPDSAHHKHFPQAILRPDEQYSQHTQYAFEKVEK
ncbi:MAG: aldose epimerase family protein [Paracoccaceae bacterium]